MKRGVKIALAAVGTLLAVLIVVIVIVNLLEGSPSASPTVKNNITYFYGHEDEMTRFVYNSTLLDGVIAGGVDSYLTVDGSVAIARAGTGLYRIDKDGPLLIYPAGVTRAALSLDNNYILFCTATKAFIYDHSTGELTEIPDLNANRVLNLVISPSAKIFGVSVIDEDGVAHTYLYRDGKTEQAWSDSCIVGISDDGDFAYYIETESNELTGTLCCVKNSETQVIAEGVSAYFELNNDLSEITFDIGEKTYYSVDGKKAEQLVDASILTVSRGYCSRMGGDGCTVLLRDLDSIFNCVYYTVYKAENANSQTMNAYDLYYVNGSHKAILLAQGATQFSVNAQSDGILCVVDGSLYEVSCFSPERPSLIAEGVYAFAVTSGRDDIYVLDQYACLNYVNRGGLKRVASNVSYFIVTKDNICLYISDYMDGSGTLNWARGARTDVITDGVYTVEAFAGGTAYYAEPTDEVLYTDDLDEREGVFDVYFSGDSLDFKLLLKQARMPISE